MAPAKRLVVIGGGIGGLVAAYDCASVGIDVTVVEARPRLGGAVSSAEIAGLRVDVGAESFATRGGSVAELIEQLGLTDRVVRPNPSGAWLHSARPGETPRTLPLPKAGILGIPSNPLADDVRRIIGWGGAVRAYLDRVRPVLTIGTERNLGALVRKRMGDAVHDLLVAPVTSGVYSAMPDDLDVERAAPGLNAAMTRTGALSLAVADLRENVPAGAAVGGLRGGMTVLVDALADALTEKGSTLVTGVAVTGISRTPFDIDADGEGVGEGDVGLPSMAERAAGRAAGAADDASSSAASSQASSSSSSSSASSASSSSSASASAGPAWYVALTDGRILEADLVIVATPEPLARNLLADADPSLAALATDDEHGAGSQSAGARGGARAGAGAGQGVDGVALGAGVSPGAADLVAIAPAPEPAPVELVTIVIDEPALDSAPRGSGLLVVPGSQLHAKALTHATAKWSWLAEQAGPHRHVVRVSFGRQGEANATGALGDEELLTIALADASEMLGVELRRETVQGFDRVSWTGTQPTAARGQKERAEAVRALVDEVPDLAVTGGWLSGTGLASVVPDAHVAGKRIRHAALTL